VERFFFFFVNPSLHTTHTTKAERSAFFLFVPFRSPTWPASLPQCSWPKPSASRTARTQTSSGLSADASLLRLSVLSLNDANRLFTGDIKKNELYVMKDLPKKKREYLYAYITDIYVYIYYSYSALPRLLSVSSSNDASSLFTGDSYIWNGIAHMCMYIQTYRCIFIIVTLRRTTARLSRSRTVRVVCSQVIHV